LAIASSALAANAENQIEGNKSLKELVFQKDFFAPCSGYIIVRNRAGQVVFSEAYASNGPTQQACSDGFLKELTKVIASYSPKDFKYETDVTWN